MLRLLFIAGLVYLLWRLAGRPGLPQRDAPPPSPGAEAMVRCDHCGVHVPASRAILEGDHWYCSPGHRDAACR